MKLSPEETRLVGRLEKWERSWRWGRWWALFTGVLMIGTGVIFYRELWKELAQEQLLLMLIAVVAPACCLFLLLGAGIVCYALAFWKGRPLVRLLLRLVKE